jgi:hypothetical protein
MKKKRWYIIFVIFLFLFPLSWGAYKYDIDRMKLTEEWYKALGATLGVGVVAIVIADRLKEGRMDKRIRNLLNQLRTDVEKIKSAIYVNDTQEAIRAIHQFFSTYNQLSLSGIGVAKNYLPGIIDVDRVIEEMRYYIGNIVSSPPLCEDAETCIKEFCLCFLSDESMFAFTGRSSLRRRLGCFGRRGIGWGFLRCGGRRSRLRR